MAGFRDGNELPAVWDGGVSRAFYREVMTVLARMYGPTVKSPDASLTERWIGPLGGVEDEYRRLDKHRPPANVVEKIAGRIIKEHG